MSKRKAFTLKQLVEIYRRYCAAQCAKCFVMSPVGKMEMDHIHPVGLGGTNEPENIQFLCPNCHDLKTNGTKATSYGSDKHEIAKTKRIVKRLAKLKKEREEEQKNKRAKQTPKSSRKIPSRPFPKRGKHGNNKG